MVVKVRRYKVATKYLKSSLECNETFALRHDSVGTSYAPYWYALKNGNNRNINMKVNLTYWMGTQADAEFASSLHSDSAIDMCCIPFTRSKQYDSPILCYLKVSMNEVVLRGNNENGANEAPLLTYIKNFK